MKVYDDLKIINKVGELIDQVENQIVIKSKLLNYDVLDQIWKDFVCKDINIKGKIDYYKILQFTGENESNNYLIESIFIPHIKNRTEDLILVYQQGSMEMLYYIKSFDLLNQVNHFGLPYFSIRVPVSDLFLKTAEFLKENEFIISSMP